MKRKMMWVALALVLFDVAFVGNARASRKLFARKSSAVQAAPLRAKQAYPLMSVHVLSAVQLPDQMLMPGHYTFTLMPDGNNVSITNSNGHLIGTYVVVPAYRRDLGDGLVETQSAANGTDRISTWFFPYQQDGYAFVYPAM